MRIFVSTGEVSGDVVGARVAAEVLRRVPEARLAGVGGARMAAAGVAIDFGTNHLGTVGITEPLFSVPAFARALVRIRRRVKSERPDAALLVGNDVFNVLLGRWLKRKGIPTLSYFPPQIWIWRSLAKPISRSFDLVLASFPEEARTYEATGVPTRFVGHYLCDRLRPVTPRERQDARRQFALDEGERVVGILPGSRVLEIRRLAPILLKAAAGVLRVHPGTRFLLPLAEPLYEQRLRREIQRHALSDHIAIVRSEPDVLRACDLLLLASGTASLEAALLGIPMVIVYRVSAVTIGVVRTAIRLGLMDSETVGLPNLIVRRQVVPEITQKQLEAAAVEREALKLLGDPRTARAMRLSLGEVAARIRGRDPVEDVAEALLRAAWRGKAAPVQAPSELARAVAGGSASRGEG